MWRPLMPQQPIMYRPKHVSDYYFKKKTPIVVGIIDPTTLGFPLQPSPGKCPLTVALLHLGLTLI